MLNSYVVEHAPRSPRATRTTRTNFMDYVIELDRPRPRAACTSKSLSLPRFIERILRRKRGICTSSDSWRKNFRYAGTFCTRGQRTWCAERRCLALDGFPVWPGRFSRCESSHPSLEEESFVVKARRGEHAVRSFPVPHPRHALKLNAPPRHPISYSHTNPASIKPNPLRASNGRRNAGPAEAGKLGGRQRWA